MLAPVGSYDDLVAGFRWDIPARLNMAEQVCDRWAEREPDRLAILDLSAGREEITYARLRRMATAHGLPEGAYEGCVNSEALEYWVLARALEVRGEIDSTPSFVITDGGREIISGARSYSEFQALLDERLAAE